MKISFVPTFFNNISCDKLFLSFFPILITYIVAISSTNNYSLINIILFIVMSILMHLAGNLLDDFVDWTSGMTTERANLEKIGVRANCEKCKYILKDRQNPRFYFYTAIIFLKLSIISLIVISYRINSFIPLIILPIIIMFVYFSYLQKSKSVLKLFGYEFFASILFSIVNILICFFVLTKTINLQIIFISLIVYFLIKNLFYTSSLLNYKSDVMTQKITLPIILKSNKYKIYFSLFLALFPYILTYSAIATNILPVYSYVCFILLPFSIWHFYLIFLFETEPQKSIKWSFLMGIDRNHNKNEQKNLSWYTVRYNFARNIFIAYIILLSASLLMFIQNG